MSKLQPSPTPWGVAHNLNETCIVDNTGYIVAQVTSPVPLIDGHMLSAAPDLVKACEAFINYNSPDDLEDAWIMARDAVLKARGFA